MAGRLQKSYANLEKKVELRTQELSESLRFTTTGNSASPRCTTYRHA